MTILPIRLITEDDQPLFGTNLVNLAKLQRAGIDVGVGVGISPAEIVIKTVVRYFKDKKSEIFEQQFNLVKSDFQKIPVPEELSAKLGDHHLFLLDKEVIQGQKNLWQGLLSIWLDQIKTRLWNEGFSDNLNGSLTAEVVTFIHQKPDLVEAFYDPHLKKVVFQSQSKLELKQIDKIASLVTESNKKLFLPQKYQLVLEKNKLSITNLSPYTDEIPILNQEYILVPEVSEKKIIKSAIKIFIESSGPVLNMDHLDGGILFAERLGDFESGVFKLQQTALSLVGKPIIYRLPDKSDGDIRGTLRLLNQKSLFDQAVETFLHVRNKQNHSTVSIGVPLVRSADEYLSLKKELSVSGIQRGSTLKIWLELGLPENILNLEKYIDIGFDGVILNLDNLHRSLLGLDLPSEKATLEELEIYTYKHQLESIIKLLTPSLKLLHNDELPILAYGEIILHPEILEFLIKNGVWGVVVNNLLQSEGLPEHLNSTERKVLLS